MSAPPPRSPVTAVIERLLPRLRYPWLFLILSGLLLVNIVVPDPVPLVDEILLAILTFVAASLTRRDEERPPPRDVTPPDEASDALGDGAPPRDQPSDPR